MVIDPTDGTIELCWGGQLENGWHKYSIQEPLTFTIRKSKSALTVQSGNRRICLSKDTKKSIREKGFWTTLSIGKSNCLKHYGTLKKVLDSREDFELYDERFWGYNYPDSQIDLYIHIR